MDVILLSSRQNHLLVNPTLIHTDFKAHDLLLSRSTFFSGSIQHNDQQIISPISIKHNYAIPLNNFP